MGTNIQSVYLRLFSDGTAECHAVKFRRDDEDAVKEKHLQPQEFAEAKALLGQPGLRQVKGRYEFPRMVIDSWMEWDMRIRNSASVRHVTISFAHLANHVTYPPALGRLGCLILKVRHDVYGDGTDYYRQACGDSQPIDAEITIPDWTRLAAPR